jgi:outer membrane autotransporter protein
MKIDLAAGKADRLVITGDASGAHRLLLSPAAGPALPGGDEPRLTLVTIGGLDGATFTDDGLFTGGFDYGAFNYVLEQRGNSLVIANHGFSTAYAPIRGVPGAQGIMWFGQQDNLGRRLGDLRSLALDDGARPGGRWELWARAHASRSDLDATDGMAASSLNLWGVEIGADKTWLLDRDRVTVGLFASHGSSSQDFDTGITSTAATGGSDLLGAVLYALWLNNNGWFASVTLSAARYKNDFDVADQSGNPNTCDYNDTGYGVTLEAGKRMTIGDASAGWFVEPAAQYSSVLINRSDYLTDGASPLSVHNENATITRLRGVLRGGRAWRHASLGVLELAGRLAFVHEACGGGEVRIGVSPETWRPNQDGNRGEAGAGLIWRPGRGNFQLHFDYEAACGDNYKKPWDISLGARLAF